MFYQLKVPVLLKYSIIREDRLYEKENRSFTFDYVCIIQVDFFISSGCLLIDKY